MSKKEFVNLINLINELKIELSETTKKTIKELIKEWNNKDKNYNKIRLLNKEVEIVESIKEKWYKYIEIFIKEDINLDTNKTIFKRKKITSEEVCSICLGENKQIMTEIKCGHCFHKKCIIQWFDKNKEASCPICREKINSKLLLNNIMYCNVCLEWGYHSCDLIMDLANYDNIFMDSKYKDPYKIHDKMRRIFLDNVNEPIGIGWDICDNVLTIYANGQLYTIEIKKKSRVFEIENKSVLILDIETLKRPENVNEKIFEIDKYRILKISYMYLNEYSKKEEENGEYICEIRKPNGYKINGKIKGITNDIAIETGKLLGIIMNEGLSESIIESEYILIEDIRDIEILILELELIKHYEIANELKIKMNLNKIIKLDGKEIL